MKELSIEEKAKRYDEAIEHGAMATLGFGEYVINVDEFRKYMKE